MKIQINRFKEDQSQRFEEKLRPEDLDIDIGVMRFPNDLTLFVEAWKVEDDLTVDAHVEGERFFQCSLCLEDFNNLFEKDFTLHYDIKGLESVTIDADVREELILDHPIRVLCRPDCRGLCPKCGVNLNRETCGCSAAR